MPAADHASQLAHGRHGVQFWNEATADRHEQLANFRHGGQVLAEAGACGYWVCVLSYVYMAGAVQECLKAVHCSPCMQMCCRVLVHVVHLAGTAQYRGRCLCYGCSLNIVNQSNLTNRYSKYLQAC